MDPCAEERVHAASLPGLIRALAFSSSTVGRQALNCLIRPAAKSRILLDSAYFANESDHRKKTMHFSRQKLFH